MGTTRIEIEETDANHILLGFHTLVVVVFLKTPVHHESGERPHMMKHVWVSEWVSHMNNEGKAINILNLDQSQLGSVIGNTWASFVFCFFVLGK